MKKAVFEELKYGDKLVMVKQDGTFEMFTYLCLDPGYKEQYAFLMLKDGIHATHFYKPTIEEMFLVENYDEMRDYARKVKADFYREWLNRYEGDQLKKYEI